MATKQTLQFVTENSLGHLMQLQQEKIISTEYLRPAARLQAVLDLERARIAYDRAARRALATMEEVEAQVRDQF